MNETSAAHPFYFLLALFALLCIVGFIVMLRWERAEFRRRELDAPWLKVRLASLPLAPLVAALVIIPARNTVGMEGLAVFYLMLLVVAPPLWLGGHWLVGRFVRPQLAFSDILRIAASPILFVIGAGMLAQVLQGYAWTALRLLGLA